MKQRVRVLGPSAYLTGFRRLRNLRNRLFQLEEPDATLPLDTVLDALGVDDAEFRNHLDKLDTSPYYS